MCVFLITELVGKISIIIYDDVNREEKCRLVVGSQAAARCDSRQKSFSCKLGTCSTSPVIILQRDDTPIIDAQESSAVVQLCLVSKVQKKRVTSLKSSK